MGRSWNEIIQVCFSSSTNSFRLFGYHYADGVSSANFTNRPDICVMMNQLGRPQGSNPEPMNGFVMLALMFTWYSECTLGCVWTIFNNT